VFPVPARAEAKDRVGICEVSFPPGRQRVIPSVADDHFSAPARWKSLGAGAQPAGRVPAIYDTARVAEGPVG